MATEISNGSQTVKLYQSVNRGKAMYQLAYYMGGRRVQKNFADKAEAKRVAKQILGGLTNDAEAVEALATPELESLVAARRVLAPNYALHVAVEEHAQAVGKLGEISLREAVEFFLRHNRADVPRLTLVEIAEQFAKSREQSGLSAHYVSQCRKTVNDLAKAFPGKGVEVRGIEDNRSAVAMANMEAFHVKGTRHVQNVVTVTFLLTVASRHTSTKAQSRAGLLLRGEGFAVGAVELAGDAAAVVEIFVLPTYADVRRQADRSDIGIEAAFKPDSLSRSMKKRRLLLADDHDLVREGLAVLIEQEPAWKICGAAKTGAEAVQKAVALRPDIAVIDFKLPGIDGLEVTRQIKRILPNCEVLIFTGSGESDELIREAFAAGAKAFILKTDAGEFLLAALKSLAEHRPFFTDKSSAVIFARFARTNKQSKQDKAETGARLTIKEESLLRLLADGHSNESVATKQGISVRAVENQRATIMKKLELKTFADLVRYAVRNGLIEA